ncbi:DNA ligase [Marinomonas agarivorans]|nr:DNA ligase [Marinomonas agarivorans]
MYYKHTFLHQLSTFLLLTFKHKARILLGILLFAFSFTVLAAPVVQLANLYHDDVNVKDFLVSEKYDGVRAIWRNGVLQTRKGNIINAPQWFTAALPDYWLDGELWSKRQDFEFVNSVVRKKVPQDTEWRQIKYMVFDAPDDQHHFLYRAEFYTRLLKKLNIPHVQPVEQWQLDSNESLSNLLKRLTDQGAEGLILHRKNARFQSKRTNNLLKLKPYMDAEASVVDHLPGKGKYKNKLGALVVSWQSDHGKLIQFKIGTGFSDQDRANPPAIGDVITFKYHGLTKNHVPRFASYLRVREKANK